MLKSLMRLFGKRRPRVTNLLTYKGQQLTFRSSDLTYR